MKKIVIFQDTVSTNKFGKSTRQRTVLRVIRPSATFCGFTKTGQPIESEIRSLMRYLEPKATGFYCA